MSEKIIAQYLKANDVYIAGDVRGLEKDEFEALEKQGIVKKHEPVAKDAPKPEELSGENIKGEQYDAGKIDAVVPTKKDSGKDKKKETGSKPSARKRKTKK